MANTYNPGSAISDSVTQFQSMFPNLARLGEVQASEILKSITNTQSYQSLDDFMGDALYKKIFSQASKAYKGGKALTGNIGSGSLPGELSELATETAASTYLPISQFREGQRQFNLSTSPTNQATSFAPAYLDAEKTRFNTEQALDYEKQKSKSELISSLGGLAGTATQAILQPYMLSKFLKAAPTKTGVSNDLLSGAVMGSIGSR